MKISVSAAGSSRPAAPLLVVPVLEGDEQDAAFRTLDEALGGQPVHPARARRRRARLSARRRSSFPHGDGAGAERVLLVGLAQGARS